MPDRKPTDPKKTGKPAARETTNASPHDTAADPRTPAHISLPKRIGRYEVQKLLGEGAFGRVFLAFDPDLDRQVAVKVPRPEGFTDDARDRFLREARATAAIHHPNVCPVLDVGTDGDLPYLVMRYLPGITLADHLDRVKTLPPAQAVALAQKLALGVAAAHEKGVIHRDLKPQNVLFDPARQLALITDFGLARIGGRGPINSNMTVDGAVCGTPMYMSPEQARGQQNAVGPRSDVYALGIILFRMLTGDVPFTGGVFEVLMHHVQTPPPRPSSVRAGIDPRLDAICVKAMAKSPADRYQTAKALADALAAFAAGKDTAHVISLVPTEPDLAPEPEPEPEPPAAEPRRRWTRVVLIALIVILAVAAVVLAL